MTAKDDRDAVAFGHGCSCCVQFTIRLIDVFVSELEGLAQLLGMLWGDVRKRLPDDGHVGVSS